MPEPATANTGETIFDADLVQRYDRPDPRYTSYPTAVQFHAGYGIAAYEAAARASNARGGGRPRPLSLYVHVPFCQNPCFYCGCNKVITRDHAQAERYLERLNREIALQGALYDRGRLVVQLHFGGGTPTFLSLAQIGALLAELARHFSLRRDRDREYSIEIDPRTLELVTGARPDRIAAYSYAHLPHVFKPQRQIRSADLASQAEKLGLLGLTVERLTAAGYVYVGMDHFALPGDELVRAQRDGTLQRNFQGYSTRAECDLVGLGVSSIGRLAVERGVALSVDDRVRRDVIQRLMCATRLDFAAIEAAHGVHFEEYFGAELASLGPLLTDGLSERGARSLAITSRGRLLLRNVAMVFDAHLPRLAPPAGAPHFSRAV